MEGGKGELVWKYYSSQTYHQYPTELAFWSFSEKYVEKIEVSCSSLVESTEISVIMEEIFVVSEIPASVLTVVTFI